MNKNSKVKVIHTHTHFFSFFKWLSIFFFPVAILRGGSCVRIIIPESLTTVAGRLKRGYGNFCFISVLNSEALTAGRILHRRSPQQNSELREILLILAGVDLKFPFT